RAAAAAGGECAVLEKEGRPAASGGALSGDPGARRSRATWSGAPTRCGGVQMSGGFVSLVGAGPGDPELLTLKAVRRLAEADLVLTDALVPGDLAALAPRARRVFLGQRARPPAVHPAAPHRPPIPAP